MSTSVTSLSPAELQKAAREHLWLHFTRMSTYAGEDIPIIVRGDGCYLEDINGKRYLDALAGLFAVNIGYGFGDEIGEAAAAQLRELPFYTNWSYAHPRAIELAAEVASVAPGDLNRVFFVSGGSEAVESAWKLARQYYSARSENKRVHVAERMEAGERIEQRFPTRAALEGRRAADRLPRDDNGRALHQRHRLDSRPVRAARPGRDPRPQHEPLSPPAGRDRGRVHRLPPRRPRGGDHAGGARDRRHGHLRARAERGRLVHAARGLLEGRARDLRPLRDPPLRRRGHHRLRPTRARGSARSATTSGPTSSRRPRASPRPTLRSAP